MTLFLFFCQKNSTFAADLGIYSVSYECYFYCAAYIDAADVRLGIDAQAGRFQAYCATSEACSGRAYVGITKLQK